MKAEAALPTHTLHNDEVSAFGACISPAGLPAGAIRGTSEMKASDSSAEGK